MGKIFKQLWLKYIFHIPFVLLLNATVLVPVDRDHHASRFPKWKDHQDPFKCIHCNVWTVNTCQCNNNGPSFTTSAKLGAHTVQGNSKSNCHLDSKMPRGLTLLKLEVDDLWQICALLPSDGCRLWLLVREDFHPLHCSKILYMQTDTVKMVASLSEDRVRYCWHPCFLWLNMSTGCEIIFYLCFFHV